jgi:hypothetical protein
MISGKMSDNYTFFHEVLFTIFLKNMRCKNNLDLLYDQKSISPGRKRDSSEKVRLGDVEDFVRI